MRVRDVFHSDSLRALSATRFRRIIGLVDTVAYGILVFALIDVISPWIWLALGVANFIVALFIGSRLADRDASARAATRHPERRSH